MIKTMTNAEIYDLTSIFQTAFDIKDSKYYPARINFFIQKNRSTLEKLSADIEKVRMSIIQNYGVIEGDKYKFTQENIPLANKELSDLLKIKQEVNISTIKLSDLDNLEFTQEQMSALMFMIEED